MAFGQQKLAKTHHVRALPAAVGELSLVKVDALQVLRQQALALSIAFAQAGFVAEPLHSPKLDQLDRRLLKAEHVFLATEGLSRAYADRVRIAARAALTEHHKRYFRWLFGRLAHVDSLIPPCSTKLSAPAADAIVRRYYFVPPAVQDTVTEAELLALKALADRPAARNRALFRRVVLQQQHGRFSPAQVAVLVEIHRQAQERWRPAELGRADSTVSLALDANMLPSGDTAAEDATAAVARLLEDPTNARYRFFLEISHPVPHQPRLRLPFELPAPLLAVRADPKNKLLVRSFTLELGPNGAVGLRVVVVKKKARPTPVTKVTHVIGRDFGQRNTAAWSVVQLARPLNPRKVAKVGGFTMAEAALYLRTHVALAEPVIAERVRYSGQAFLRRVVALATKIDRLTSRIDTEYNTLDQEKRALVKSLGLTPNVAGVVLVDQSLYAKTHPAFGLVQGFFQRLNTIRCLKQARRANYRKIAAVKKSWFGFLANVEVALAKKWNAAVVREDLTYETEAKDSANYRGRLANRLTNHNSRGQYTRRATPKLGWNGVPEIVLPSYYTSTTCFRHAVVDKAQRKGDVFSCTQCLAQGRDPEHADEHAADTLALYATLGLISKVTPASPAV